MSLSFTNGTTGVNAHDMVVYMQERDDDYSATAASTGSSYLEDAIADSGLTLTALTYITGTAMEEIGELRKDSISIKTDSNDSVDLNVSGTMVLNKTFTLGFNIANVTSVNIAGLEAADGKSVDLLIIERESGTDERKVFVAYDVIYNYKEDLTSGTLQEIPVEFTKVVPRVSDVRKVRVYPTS